MPAQRFLIAPYDKDSGLTTNLKPWIIPDTAFAALDNAYVFRGRVRKRVGSKWFSASPLLSRFRVLVDTSDSGGSSSGTVPAAAGAVGQAFSIGTNIYTVQALGSPVNMLVDGIASTARFDTATGIFTFTGVPALTSVYWYPNLPVMGLLSMQTFTVNNDFLIGFDTKYAYQYIGGWQRLNGEVTAGAATWAGTDDYHFFWGTTWTASTAAEKYFFVTNFNASEPNYMRFYNPTSAKWDNFRPLIGGIVYLDSCRIMVVFHNRLICLNTWEGGKNYTNRARYSWIGDPTDQANSFLVGIPGNGSSIDASTTESIVSAEFIKDRLIVYFEKSTWELVYIGNQAYPFTWQLINTELGAESTFSIVPFDKVALGIGNVGIHACNGANVERIDIKIPDQIFSITNQFNGPDRVYGIRDYFTELVYWTLPNSEDVDSSNYFPNKILTYNYRTGTWSFFDDSVTAFGYFQPSQSNSVTWDSTTVTWDDPVPWGSGESDPQFRQVAGGNQQGYTFIFVQDETTNASVLQITNVSTVSGQIQLNIINHNLKEGIDFIYIQQAAWDDASNSLNGQIYEVINQYSGGIIDPNNIIITPNASYTGNYVGGGVVSRVSRINIETKEYNFFAEQGRNAYIPKVEFLVSKTDFGEITANYFVSTSDVPLLQDSITSGVAMGNGILETSAYPTIPLEQTASRVWHPVYFQADGEVIKFQLRLSDAQMLDVNVGLEDFELHAMMIYAEKTSYRFQ